MCDEIFIIDANIILQPYNSFYSSKIAPGFWDKIKKHIVDRKIIIIDLVREELKKGDEELKSWINDQEIEIVSHEDSFFFSKYREIIQYIQNNPCYTESALHEWSRLDVADPWLIAVAAVKGYTLITFEKGNSNLNKNYPSKNPKNPDVACEFEVETKDLFYMMEKLGITLW